MIYLPIDIYDNYCAYWYDNNTIRVFYQKPITERTSYDYIDFFTDNHYYSKTGSQYIYSVSDLDCISKDNFTSDIYYRNDITDILICFVILISIPLILIKLFLNNFRKRAKL